MIGITSYGAYIPKLRLDRQTMYQAMGWFAPALIAIAQGERSVCNWDEDTLTMAVSAAFDSLKGRDKQALDAVYLASTTFPFQDRQNAGILSCALNLEENILAADMGGSQKSGTTSLITALEKCSAGTFDNILVTASDTRRTKPGSFYEMWYGDGAAALGVGSENVLAEYLGSYSLSLDFNEHYRGEFNYFDQVWEERWARDEGYSKIIPRTVQGLLEKLEISAGQVDKLIYPCVFKRDHKKIAKVLGADPEAVVDNMHEACGETGSAHSLLMLARALEDCEPGETVVVAGFGHGCNALCFRTTENIKSFTPKRGVSACLEHKKSLDSYNKYLVFKQLLEPDMGMRAEADNPTAMSVLWRNRKMLLGLVGGKCTQCGSPQFPMQDICVNPDCGAQYSQEEYEFANRDARIKTYTGDMLAASVEPPHKYGLIEFEQGGRFLADFTDCELEELQVGLPMEMCFRIRMMDHRRGNRQYFWKARPVPGAEHKKEQISYDGRVAVITGAGGGLGRVYALEMAKRGARVVVNDLGGARDGSGSSTSAADQVVQEIKDLGGEAVANYDNIADSRGGENVINTALSNFGRVDIVINNAGILQDKSLSKMGPEQWQSVLDVHLNGAYNVTRPAFEKMREQGFGRIVMTTSGAGLYGNFGQTNYSAAKMGLLGLMNTLRQEGEKKDIKVNSIAPLAGSRLTRDILPEDMFNSMKPEFVAPMVLYLASRDCDKNGAIYNCALGYYNRTGFLTGRGISLGDRENPPTVEQVAEHWEEINSLDDPREYTEANSALMEMFS